SCSTIWWPGSTLWPPSSSPAGRSSPPPEPRRSPPMLPEALIDAASALLEACREAGLTIATAESCTGGLIAGCLTEVPGSSDVLERGFVTYSNEAKTDLLGVPMPLILRHGAVSEEVAKAMAVGA